MKKIFYISAFILLFGFSLGTSHTAFAIGQITKPILIENVMREQTVTAELLLLNTADDGATYHLSASDDIESWTQFYKITDIARENPITEIQIPTKENIRVTAAFTPPAGTPNGTYTGEVVIATAPNDKDEEEGAKANVRLRIGREVTITVTDKEVVEFVTTVIPVSYDVKSGKPLEIGITYKNNGNVSIKPDIELTITKDQKTIFTAIFPYPKDEEGIKPQKEKTIPKIQWSTIGVEDGIYRANIMVLVSDKEFTIEDFRFTVGLKSGSLLGLIAAVGGGNLTLSWFIIGGILVIISGVLFVIYKRRRPVF